MIKYRVLALDVWGNEDDGWEVNQWFYTDNFIHLNENWDIEELLKELKGECLLREFVTVEYLEVEERGERIFIESKVTGEPLYWLEEAGRE